MAEVTFDVSPEVQAGPPLPPVDYRKSLASSLRGPIEALWSPARPLVSCSEDHALLTAVHDAFYKHYPLQLSPDIIWITLARGFAVHVNLHAERFRERFVSHAGRKTLVVDRPDFYPGKDNPWPEAFATFSDQIAQHVGKMRDFVRCDFSTTGPVERAASELMVMDTFQAYFEYEMMCGCGIPSITLTGTVDDWKSIRARARLFGEFGLEKWCHALDPILDQFVAAAEGRAHIPFWKSLFRYNSGSGSAVMTGWINVLFPYLFDRQKSLRINPYFEDWGRRIEIDASQGPSESRNDPQGVALRQIPPCLTSVPLKVFWGTRECAMRLVGGLMGVSQDPANLTLTPECGWAVVHEPAPTRIFSKRPIP